MKQLLGIIILLVIVWVVSGPSKAIELAENLIEGLGKILFFLAECIVKVLPMLEVEDAIITLLIFSVILMLASAFGIYLSRKNKSTLWTVISTSVEIISTITTIVSALALK